MIERIKKLFTQKSNISLRQVILWGLVLVLSHFTALAGGFYMGTGTFPDWTGSESKPILVPDLAVSSSTDVDRVLKEDATDSVPYQEGWNCVEYAWSAMRALQWGGIPSGIVRLSYEDGTYHAILITPTDDKGWIFIDPQTDAEVKPKLGGMYGDKRIVSMHIMIMSWVDILEFYDSPEFGIIEEDDK